MRVWNASVDMTVRIDYDDIEADTREDAERIAIDRAREDIDFNNCDADEDGISAFVWTDKGDEDDVPAFPRMDDEEDEA